MKKHKIQAGVYLYGGLQLEKEYMGDTVGMKAVRRWMISKLDSRGWLCIDDAPSLKAAMAEIDRMIQVKGREAFVSLNSYIEERKANKFNTVALDWF